MTFATPLALLALLLIPLVILALVLARRRRIRYAIRYPALDVLAGVVERERRGRWIPAALLVLALTALLLGAARPMARVPVYTIALGTAGGVLRQPNAFGGTRIQPVPPDPDSLARIAETSNGRFFEAPSSGPCRRR